MQLIKNVLNVWKEINLLKNNINFVTKQKKPFKLQNKRSFEVRLDLSCKKQDSVSKENVQNTQKNKYVIEKSKKCSN